MMPTRGNHMTADLLRVALNNQDMAEMSARVARVARDEGRFEYVLIFQQEADRKSVV